LLWPTSQFLWLAKNWLGIGLVFVLSSFSIENNILHGPPNSSLQLGLEDPMGTHHLLFVIL
jgi:hypothetical protein